MKSTLNKLSAFIFCLLTTFCSIPQIQTIGEQCGTPGQIIFDVVNGHCLFDGNINGKSAKFCIDNGCDVTMIDSAFFFSEILDTNKFIVKSIKRRINCYTYSGELQISTGGVMYGIDEFRVINFNNIGAEGIHLILGYDILKDRVLKIDFSAETIEIISDAADLDSSGYHKTLLMQSEKYFHRKFFEADVFTSNINNHKKGKFILDLGCGGNTVDVMFKQKFFNFLQKDVTQKGSGFAKSVCNQSQTQSLTMWHIDSIVLSDICFPNVSAATVSIMLTNGPEDPFVMDSDIYAGLIGWGFFKDRCIAIDFKNNLLFVKRSGSKKH
jgi:hypothetical protein